MIPVSAKKLKLIHKLLSPLVKIMNKETVQFINSLSATIASQPATHSHEQGGPSHSHEHGDHGHTHEHLENAGESVFTLLSERIKVNFLTGLPRQVLRKRFTRLQFARLGRTGIHSRNRGVMFPNHYTRC